MNLTVLEQLIAAPYVSLFNEFQLALILIAFFFFLMLFYQLDFGAVALFMTVVLFWFGMSAVGLSSSVGLGGLAIILAVAALLMFGYRTVFK